MDVISAEPNQSGCADDVIYGDKLGHPVTHGFPVSHPHKLEKKQSSGDLHSRLKTRKLLGVGETPDGDVHRSKLSQILGHNDQLYTRLPRGIQGWQYANAIAVTYLAVLSLLLPSYANLPADVADIDREGSSNVAAVCAGRMHGAALTGFAILLWSSLHSIDKDLIRNVALASACYWSLNVGVVIMSLLQAGLLTEAATGMLPVRLVALSASLYYHRALCRRDCSRPTHVSLVKHVADAIHHATIANATSLFNKKNT